MANYLAFSTLMVGRCRKNAATTIWQSSDYQRFAYHQLRPMSGNRFISLHQPPPETRSDRNPTSPPPKPAPTATPPKPHPTRRTKKIPIFAENPNPDPEPEHEHGPEPKPEPKPGPGPEPKPGPETRTKTRPRKPEIEILWSLRN